MSEALDSSIDRVDHQLPPDYLQKIADYLRQIRPDIELPERTINLMVTGLNHAYNNYGNGQLDEARREYHNDEHAFEVFQRAVEWLQRFEEHFDITFTVEDYEVAGLAACYHDIILNKTDDSTKSVETQSADEAVAAMTESPIRFTTKMKRRVRRAIEATTMHYTKEGDVFQTSVMKGNPDYVVVAIALADASAIVTESPETIIDHVSKLAMEGVPPGSTDITVITDAAMKLLKNEDKFGKQRFDDAKKYLEFLCKDPEKVTQIFDDYYGSHQRRVLGFTALIDSQLSNIQQNITDTLGDSRESTERAATRIYRGIMRGLAFLPKSE